MKQSVPIVNASTILPNDQVRACVEALQVQYDRDFKPAWGDAVPDIMFSFADIYDIPHIHPAAWPLFLNRHSQDPGALGWHANDSRVFGRVFVGDCLAYGISWTVDVSHEALEMALDPDAKKVWRMPNGDLAAFEACDAVESDDYAYRIINGGRHVLVSDFVLPSYFGADRAAHHFDFGSRLKGPCPELTPGGYMSILKPGQGWTMVQEDHRPGVPGLRFLQSYRGRRVRRSELTEADLQIVPNQG